MSVLGLIHTASRAEPNLTRPSWTRPSEWLFTLQAEPTQTESSAADISELQGYQSACIFINGQYLVEKPLIY